MYFNPVFLFVFFKFWTQLVYTKITIIQFTLAQPVLKRVFIVLVETVDAVVAFLLALEEFAVVPDFLLLVAFRVYLSAHSVYPQVVECAFELTVVVLLESAFAFPLVIFE